jgi:hypothetical protein
VAQTGQIGQGLYDASNETFLSSQCLSDAINNTIDYTAARTML